MTTIAPKEHPFMSQEQQGYPSWPWLEFFDDLVVSIEDVGGGDIDPNLDVQTDSNGNFIGVANTGTGNNVMSADPTISGTLTTTDISNAGDLTSGNVTVTGVTTLSNLTGTGSRNAVIGATGIVGVGAGLQGVTRVTTTYTILSSDENVFGDTDSAGFTMTLPAGTDGQHFKIMNTGTGLNLLDISPNGAELLIGENSNFELNAGESLDLVYNVIEGWA